MLKDRQFLAITPSYKYRAATAHKLKKFRSTCNHARHNSSLKAYRAYDKEHLLQEIDNKIDRQNRAIEQNRQLKEKINNATSSLSEKSWSNGQIILMMVSMQEENSQLYKQLEQKRMEVEQIKRSPEFNQFQQIYNECLVYQEELTRLKNIMRERKKQKSQQRRIIMKARNQKLTQLANKERGIKQTEDRNQQLKEYLETVQEELRDCKNKNKAQIRTKRKLIEDITSLSSQLKVNQRHKMQILTTSGTLNSVIKTKSSKQTSPVTILETLEQNQTSPIRAKQKQKSSSNSLLIKPTGSESQNQQQDSSEHSSISASSSSSVHNNPADQQRSSSDSSF